MTAWQEFGKKPLIKNVLESHFVDIACTHKFVTPEKLLKWSHTVAYHSLIQVYTISDAFCIFVIPFKLAWLLTSLTLLNLDVLMPYEGTCTVLITICGRLKLDTVPSCTFTCTCMWCQDCNCDKVPF